MENQENPEQPQEQAVEQAVEQPQEQAVEQAQQDESLSNQEKNYNHLQKWFLRSEINQLLSNYMDKSMLHNILDICSFEGIATAYFADNFLDNENSTLTCVHGYLNIDHDIKYLQNGEELNFDFNISNCKNSNRIIVKKITLDSFFETNSKTYNLIYIDGSRESEFIKRDIEKSFEFLENNGIIWINNYYYGKEIYDTVLETYQGQYDIIHNQYQLAIKKK